MVQFHCRPIAAMSARGYAEATGIAAFAVTVSFPSPLRRYVRGTSAGTSGVLIQEIAHLIITIDGPAGSGKSATAELLAQRLNVPHLDTGAMYRAVALKALQNGISEANPDQNRIAQLAEHIDLDFDWSTHPARILLDKCDVSNDIRKPEVTAIVHLPADNKIVRAELVRQQRLIAAHAGSLVTEGRDQGTLVFPDADYKFYLDADIKERTRRRLAELTDKGIAADPDALLADMQARDQRDKSRGVGALLLAGDAIVLDTTALTLPQVVVAMVKIIGSRKNG